MIATTLIFSATGWLVYGLWGDSDEPEGMPVWLVWVIGVVVCLGILVVGGIYALQAGLLEKDGVAYRLVDVLQGFIGSLERIVMSLIPRFGVT